MEFKNFNFLKPRWVNVLITLIILSLPILRERAVLPTGGFEVVAYRPIFLLASYLQMGDYYPFFLMVGFSLFVYLAVSTFLAVASKIFSKALK